MGRTPAAAAPPGGERVTVNLWVPGVPAPQGSKRHVGRGVLVESSKRLPAWRAAVEHHARQWVGTHFGAWEPMVGPVGVSVKFFLPRPERCPRELPCVRPDVDKLVRAALDALTNARIFGDDGQVVDLITRKRYADPEPGAFIRAWAL